MTPYFVVKRGNIVVYRHFYFTLKVNIVRETMFENVIPYMKKKMFKIDRKFFDKVFKCFFDSSIRKKTKTIRDFPFSFFLFCINFGSSLKSVHYILIVLI